MLEMQQLPLALAPPPLADFASFWAEDSNALALAHLRAATPPTAPIYMWGPRGSGKTHLVQALAQACAQQGLHCGLVHAGVTLPWVYDPAWSVLIVDDIQGLDGAAQHQLFALLIEAQAHGVSWVATGDCPPVDLPLRDDLRSRIGWGHSFALQPLDEAQTRAVLQREAARRGIGLSAEVEAYLLNRFERDLKNLMALLDRLDEFALAQARPVTIPLLKLMLAQTPAQTPAQHHAQQEAQTHESDAF